MDHTGIRLDGVSYPIEAVRAVRWDDTSRAWRVMLDVHASTITIKDLVTDMYSSIEVWDEGTGDIYRRPHAKGGLMSETLRKLAADVEDSEK